MVKDISNRLIASVWKVMSHSLYRYLLLWRVEYEYYRVSRCIRVVHSHIAALLHSTRSSYRLLNKRKRKNLTFPSRVNLPRFRVQTDEKINLRKKRALEFLQRSPFFSPLSRISLYIFYCAFQLSVGLFNIGRCSDISARQAPSYPILFVSLEPLNGPDCQNILFPFSICLRNFLPKVRP